jgi:dihydroorotate dehydrogenase electron transfer subunit
MSEIMSPCEKAHGVASYRCRIQEHGWVNRRYRYIRVESEAALARVTKPGQFYQLKCPVTDDRQPFLLRPMSVYGTGPGDGQIEFLYNVTGLGTGTLATLECGDHLDIVGPLGNQFTFRPEYERVLFVARGVGLATMAPLVQRAARSGVAITSVLSARSRDDLLDKAFLRGANAQQYITFGEAALEQRMACGMGVCLSCVRLFDCGGERQFLRVCREGPVFPIRDVLGEVEFG